MISGGWKMLEKFAKLSRRVSDATGSPYAFIAALCLVTGWAATGPMFAWSDTHSLVINTITTIITFLMVFLIQSSQNRDTLALHLKLDDLLCSIKEANDSLVDIEHGTDHDLAEARARVTAASGASSPAAGSPGRGSGSAP